MKKAIALAAYLLLVLSVSAGWAGAPQEPVRESQPEEMIVPEGTVIPIVLTAYLNTRNTKVGDTVYAETTYPIWVQQRLVIPKGSSVRGTITEVVRPGRIKGKGRMAVRLDDILLPNGVRREFIASFRGIHDSDDENLDRKTETVSSGGSKGTDVGTVIGTTTGGAIIGAIVGNSSGSAAKGAAIGGGAGAAAGIATMLFTRGRDLVLTPGTQFELELKKPMKFAYNELQFTDAEISRAQRVQPAQAAPREPAPSRRRTWPLPGIGLPIPLH
jgi:type IV secretion system protein VirB10